MPWPHCCSAKTTERLVSVLPYHASFLTNLYRRGRGGRVAAEREVRSGGDVMSKTSKRSLYRGSTSNGHGYTLRAERLGWKLAGPVAGH